MSDVVSGDVFVMYNDGDMVMMFLVLRIEDDGIWLWRRILEQTDILTLGREHLNRKFWLAYGYEML